MFEAKRIVLPIQSTGAILKYFYSPKSQTGGVNDIGQYLLLILFLSQILLVKHMPSILHFNGF
jgi:hypothetical protein